jgi:EamA domain-containing membrane protein RarD
MPLHHASGRWRLGLALSLLTTFLWGILPIALTVMLQALDVYTIAWFRFLVSFGLLAVYLAVRQQLPEPQKLRSTTLRLLAIA